MTGGYVTLARFLEKKFAPDSLAGFSLQKREGFCETRVLQEVPEPRIQFAVMLILPCQNGHRDILQSLQVSRGIPIPPWMIGDDGYTAAKQIDEVLMHGR